MEFGASIFFTDYSITPADLAVALEERGFEVRLGGGAFAHPGAPAHASAGWRRTGEAVL